ncbi:MAG: ABC transporter ATP-binding protein [Thermodesulfovibrionales bacterium]|nr:ABC transporter ATP-binding protein [Thermodesulfovibrionales bacterium]
MAEIKFEKVKKRFKDITVVKELGLTINNGEFFTFVGPSGCGKSTILNMIAGLEAVTEGKIYFDDTIVNELSPKERDVAMVFQSYALYPHMTVYENIAFPLMMKKISDETIDAEVKRVAALLGLEEMLNRKPRELSGGQRQRVALGRAIIRRPKVFLMDEPLSNLDARLRVEMRAELKRLYQELKITTVYVTHDQAEALSLSDRIAVLHQGEIQQCGTPLEVYLKPANIFVGGFIGSPTMNFITGSVQNLQPLEINCNGLIFSPVLESLPEKNSVIMGIRPEDIIVSDEKADKCIEVTVSLLEPAGSLNWADFVWKGVKMKGNAKADLDIKAGKKAFMKLPMDKVIVFDRDSGRRL